MISLEAMEALGLTKRSPPVPYAIMRLNAIKPGERVVYYSGKQEEIGAAPESYRALVNSVFDFARGQFLAGRVMLRQEKRIIPGRVGYPRGFEVIDYVAVGKARP
jgi:hypothetical protein